MANPAVDNPKYVTKELKPFTHIGRIKIIAKKNDIYVVIFLHLYLTLKSSIFSLTNLLKSHLSNKIIKIIKTVYINSFPTVSENELKSNCLSQSKFNTYFFKIPFKNRFSNIIYSIFYNKYPKLNPKKPETTITNIGCNLTLTINIKEIIAIIIP